jgi:DNA-binding NarL/FixJ family response regulator
VRGELRLSVLQMARAPKSNPAELGKVRVLIVDDQPIVRERVAQLINSEADMTACGDTDNSRTAFELAAAQRPDLVITGLSLKDSHGLEFVKDLHARYPRLQVLVFSMYDESLYAERLIRAGASGFVSKHRPTKELLSAVRRVLSGDIHLSERVTAHAVRRFFARSSPSSDSQLEILSDRELEVFELIGRGYSSRQIASTLRLDLKTIETYRLRIKVKLKLTTATELAQHAQQSLQRNISHHSLCALIGPRRLTPTKRRVA